MSAIFGVVPLSESTVPSSYFNAAIAKMRDWPCDRTELVSASNHCLMICRRFTTPEAECAEALEVQHGTIILFDGRLDNRMALSQELDVDGAAADDTFVRAAWQKWGDGFAQHLLGDFAIAIYCETTGRLVLARDHLGMRPLYYIRTEEFFAFSTAIPSLLELPGVDHAWDRIWLADYLEQVNADIERTAYRSIDAVPPAHVLQHGGNGTDITRYWSLPTYDKPIEIGQDAAYARVRELLEEAVACRLRRYGGISCELSGGLDSSSVAAIAADQLAGQGARMTAITQVFAAGELREAYSDQDESRFATAICDNHSNIDQWEVTNSADNILEVIDQSLKAHGAPQRRDFTGFASEGLACAGSNGVRIMLSGFGGDQLVSSQIFGLMGSFWDEKDYPAWREFMAARKGRLSAWARYLFRRIFPPKPASQPGLFPAKGKLARDPLLLEAGYPARAIANPIRSGSGTHRQREAKIIASPTIAFRLQETAIGAGASGIEYRYPLLDIRLLEFVHNLPTRYRRHMGLGRLPLREAMRGRVPDSLRLRDDKSGTAIPGVVINIIQQAASLRAFLEPFAVDGAVAKHVCFDDAIEALLQIEALSKRQPSEPIDLANLPVSLPQILRLILLCRWAQQDPGLTAS